MGETEGSVADRGGAARLPLQGKPWLASALAGFVASGFGRILEWGRGNATVCYVFQYLELISGNPAHGGFGIPPTVGTLIAQ